MNDIACMFRQYGEKAHTEQRDIKKLLHIFFRETKQCLQKSMS